MKKHLFIGVLLVSLVSGCGTKQKNHEKVAQNESKQVSEWSCTHQENLDQIQNFLKAEYLKSIDKTIRDTSQYVADQSILKKINDGLSFKINNVRTITTDPDKTNKLECEGQIMIQFPNGLQKRAENSYLENGSTCMRYECEEESSDNSNLHDYLDSRYSKLTLNQDELKGKFNFEIIKTDKDGYDLNVQNQDDVIQGVTYIAEKAVFYESYVKENKAIKERAVIDQKQDVAQKALAQKAMDIRKKELDEDKKKQVEKLNQTWDHFTDEQKEKLKQDQKDWFEKRDVDCQVISQRTTDTSENEQEVYQKQSLYWDDAMRMQNQQMLYSKCFNKKTQERVVYLSNIFN